MTTLRQCFKLALLLPALIVAAAASTALADEATANQDSSETRTGRSLASAFHLRGVLVSSKGRSALVNGTISYEGDQVGGVEILDIHEDGVRVMAAGEVLNIPVGARAEAGAIRRSNIMITRNRAATPRRPAEKSLPTRPSDAADIEVSLASADENARVHRVRPGDTLAGIASDYVTDGVSLDQVMAEVFSSNRNAFGDSINTLFASALLTIPTRDQLQRSNAAEATAEIRRHMQRWRGDLVAPTRMANKPALSIYGPVQTGDTLSEITAQLDLDGVTAEQAMMALFTANAHAFDGNINRLLAGEILTIPDVSALQLTSPDLAAAEVQRHLSAWKAGRSISPSLADNSMIDTLAAWNELAAQHF